MKTTPKLNRFSRLPSQDATRYVSISESGFALIATISVMVLLVMIALAMLSLSTIELRASQNGRAKAEAQANARVSLMLAIGQLQKSAGPDQAITASNAFADTQQNRHWTGVWKPMPSATLNGANYDKDSYFRQWLVSGASDQDLANSAFPSTSSGNDTIRLLGAGTLGENADTNDFVDVPLLKVGNEGQGGLAWWTSDDCQKARIDLSEAEDPTTLTRVEKMTRLGAPAQVGRKSVEAFSKLAEMGHELKFIASKGNTELLDFAQKSEIRRHWHDYTVNSRGLLVNARDGGLKHDFSLLLENASLPSSFTNDYGEFIYQHTYGHPRQTDNNWLHNNFTNGGIYWSYLQDYYRLYKGVSSSGRVPLINHKATVGSVNASYRKGVVSYQPQQSVMPVFAKLQFIMSAFSVKTTAPGEANPSWNMSLVTDPVVTLWNPYPVKLRVTNLKMRPYAMPWEFKITANGSSRTVHHLDILPYHSIYLNFPADLTLEPGETRVFSNNVAEPLDVDWSVHSRPSVAMTEGWGGAGGYYNSRKSIAGNGSVKVEMQLADQYAYEQSGGWGGKRIGALYWGTYASGSRADWSMESWKEIPKVSDNGLLTVGGSPNNSMSFINLQDNKTELCAFNFYLKTAKDPQWPSRSWIHGNPCAFDNHMIVYDLNVGGSLEALELAQNRLFMSVKYAGDLDLVQIDAGSNAGFIASGQTAGDGVTHAVHQDIPVLPLQSLAQLQHANLISTGFAPFQSKAVANSLAHPMLYQASIREAAYKTQTGTEELDHSFWLNDRLFDQWYFSTITPQNSAYFGAHGTNRSMAAVYSDFTSGKDTLLNSRFSYRLPIDQTMDTAKSTLFLDSGQAKPDAYRMSAAQLNVEGAFNVNSTSKHAWKMMLSSLQGSEIPHLEKQGGGFVNKLHKDAQNPFSRYAQPVSDSVEKAADQRAARWLGFRELTDDQLYALAEAVVEQVKKRGPFLSLSDFVNRRVENSELSTMGALQAAIEVTDINDDFKKPVDMITADDLNGIAYDNLDAAVGSRHAGAPGYLMQSDLLTPLAPVIQVRGDTFTIRAYGDARNASGDIIARAWCEAVVQRSIDYLDTIDTADTAPKELTSSVNELFGRRFDIVSFRWLAPQSI